MDTVTDPNTLQSCDSSTTIPEVQEFKKYESEVSVVVQMGKNRIVRRLLGAVGLPVMELERTRIGPLTLENLNISESQHVHLSKHQIHQLWECAGGIEAIQKRKILSLIKQVKTDNATGGEHDKGCLNKRLATWMKAAGCEDLVNLLEDAGFQKHEASHNSLLFQESVDQNQCID